MSALMELRGLSRMTMKICSSFSRLMKLPNQDFLASLPQETRRKQKNVKTTETEWKHPRCHPCTLRVFVFLTPLLQRHTQSSVYLFHPSASAALGRRKQRIPQRK